MNRLTRAAARCLGLLTLAASAGCTHNKQYNIEPSEYLSSVTHDESAEPVADLAVIEFDEFGMFWDREQLEAAIDLVERRNAESERGIAVMFYVHGWMNNADPEGEENDLQIFRNQVRDVALRHGDNPEAPDTFIGVYLGWRGKTSTLPLHSTTTFWDRRRTAERVASYHVREAFSRLFHATDQRPDSKVIVTGHSMGGLIVGRSLRPLVHAGLLGLGEEGVPLRTDLVMLQNPAADALSCFQLIEYLKRTGATLELHHADGTVEPSRGPMIVSITGQADWVTRVAYTAGQIYGTRNIDTRKDNPAGVPSQWHLATRAEGHVDFLVSHRAWVEDGEVKLERVEGAYNDTPYWIVRVSPEICRDHSDIRNDRYRELVAQIATLSRFYESSLTTVVRRSSNQEGGPGDDVIAPVAPLEIPMDTGVEDPDARG